MSAIAEAPIVGERVSPRWAMSTMSTMEEESQEFSTASESPSPEQSIGGSFAIVPYAGVPFYALPRIAGRAVFVEGTPEQVGLTSDAIVISSLLPRLWRMPGWLLTRSQPLLSHPVGAGNLDVVDWEQALLETPQRPSGTIKVTLEYAGRSKPIPAGDPWSD